MFLRLVFKQVYLYWLPPLDNTIPWDPRTEWQGFTVAQKVRSFALCLIGLYFIPWLYEWLWEASHTLVSRTTLVSLLTLPNSKKAPHSFDFGVGSRLHWNGGTVPA